MALENAVVFGSLALAASVVLARALSIPQLKLRKLVSLPNWEFSKSWSSTFTVFAAVISALTSSALVPEPPQFVSSSGNYVALAIAFGLIVTLAPFLYRSVSTLRGGGPAPEYDGPVWAFLVCTALALWATLGQLAIVVLFLLETQPASLPQPSAVVLVVPFVIVGIALVGHVFRAMRSIIDAAPGVRDEGAPRPTWDLF